MFKNEATQRILDYDINLLNNGCPIDYVKVKNNHKSYRRIYKKRYIYVFDKKHVDNIALLISEKQFTSFTKVKEREEMPRQNEK